MNGLPVNHYTQYEAATPINYYFDSLVLNYSKYRRKVLEYLRKYTHTS